MVSNNHYSIPPGFNELEGDELSPEQEERAYNDYIDHIDCMVSEGIE